jgi:hypothetical protein
MATGKSDPDETTRKAQAMRYALERRYPGVGVHVSFIDHGWENAYKGWNVLFEALDPRTLINYQLASALSDFGSDGDDREYAERALTKKMQTQVLRLLKPLIKGTWTAPGGTDVSWPPL